MDSVRPFIAALMGLAASAAFAQTPIVVTVKDMSSSCTNQECVWGTFAATDDIRIDLGAVWAVHPNYDFIRVDSTDSGADIYRITLHNDSSGFVPSDVRLLVADRSGASTLFPVSIISAVPAACDDWGGTDTTPGPALVIESTVPNSTRLILAAAVGGDIRGDITCGQVFTLQAIAGSISGTIRATTPDGLGASDEPPENEPDYAYAIQRVVCRDGLFGNIIAGVADAPNPGVIPPNCSIRSIIVGGDIVPNSAGIHGNILAYGGHIRSVSSSGPIGAENAHVSIQSRWGLTTLVCEAFDANDVRLPRDVHADIRVNWINLAPPVLPQHTEPREVDWDEEGWIRQMIVSGDLHGTIEANIVRPKPTFLQSGYENSDPNGNTFGMFVTGAHHASVSLRNGMLVTSMVAAEFTEPIIIDTYLKGKIVATAGRIESLSIGGDPHLGSISGSPYWGHGFLAGTTRPDWDASVLYPLSCANDPGFTNEPQPLIRAATSIGYLNISQMINGNKIVPQMVESPVIEVLRIGQLARGVIWSGIRSDCTPRHSTPCPEEEYPCPCDQYEDAGTRCGADPADPASYVVLGDAEIGDTTGWIFTGGQTPQHEYDTGLYAASFDRLDILGRHTAHLYLYSLSPSETVRIGCAFGRLENDQAGRIFVEQAEGLQGQIIINAHAATSNAGPCAASPSGDTEIGWWERVCVSAIPEVPFAEYILCTPNITTRTPTDPADAGPFYERACAALGGGAIGQVPFAVHATDCEPAIGTPLYDPNNVSGDRTFSNAAFSQVPYWSTSCLNTPAGSEYGDTSIVIEFYGPVRRESGTVNPYIIGIESNGAPDYSTDYGQWTTCEIEQVPAGGAARRLRIRGVDYPSLIAGHYYIKPRLTGAERLLCDGLLPGTEDTPVADFTYDFALFVDQNSNGQDDVYDGPDICYTRWPCDPDYTMDGNVDQDDVTYLINVVGGGSNQTYRDPDFNRDGNVDQDDVAALVDVIAGGPCP